MHEWLEFRLDSSIHGEVILDHMLAGVLLFFCFFSVSVVYSVFLEPARGAHLLMACCPARGARGLTLGSFGRHEQLGPPIGRRVLESESRGHAEGRTQHDEGSVDLAHAGTMLGVEEGGCRLSRTAGDEHAWVGRPAVSLGARGSTSLVNQNKVVHLN